MRTRLLRELNVWPDQAITLTGAFVARAATRDDARVATLYRRLEEEDLDFALFSLFGVRSFSS